MHKVLLWADTPSETPNNVAEVNCHLPALQSNIHYRTSLLSHPCVYAISTKLTTAKYNLGYCFFPIGIGDLCKDSITSNINLHTVESSLPTSSMNVELYSDNSMRLQAATSPIDLRPGRKGSHDNA